MMSYIMKTLSANMGILGNPEQTLVCSEKDR